MSSSYVQKFLSKINFQLDDSNSIYHDMEECDSENQSDVINSSGMNPSVKYSQQKLSLPNSKQD